MCSMCHLVENSIAEVEFGMTLSLQASLQKAQDCTRKQLLLPKASS